VRRVLSQLSPERAERDATIEPGLRCAFGLSRPPGPRATLRICLHLSEEVSVWWFGHSGPWAALRASCAGAAWRVRASARA
jgi:hypothetical protein